MIMTIATEYTREWLLKKPMAITNDKTMKRITKDFFNTHNGERHEEVYNEFKIEFTDWLHAGSLNNLTGFDAFPERDICNGCTQFIHDLYISYGPSGLMTVQNDYRYHWRLNKEIEYMTLNNIEMFSLNKDGSRKPLLITMPFPHISDVHHDMDELLDKCNDLDIPVHIDGAWITCCRDITFNFDHPAIKSFAISLSKGLGLGWSRIGVRYSRKNDPRSSIYIINDHGMNCMPLTWLGLHFLRNLEPDYCWRKYGKAYYKVCFDFDLIPTKAIHVARLQDGTPVGVRALIKYLADND